MSILLPDFDLPSPTLDDFRDALTKNGLSIEDDESEMGYLSFLCNDWISYVSVSPHEAYLPLQYFEYLDCEYRTPFDEAFSSAESELTARFGQPSGESQHIYAHCDDDQFYRFAWWQLQHCRLVLAQDERDVQFGLDLSVRFVYGSGLIESLVFRTNG